jgi:hypothetical protein
LLRFFFNTGGQGLQQLLDNSRAVSSLGTLGSDGVPNGGTAPGSIPEPASMLVWCVLAVIVGAGVNRRFKVRKVLGLS